MKSEAYNGARKIQFFDYSEKQNLDIQGLVSELYSKKLHDSGAVGFSVGEDISDLKDIENLICSMAKYQNLIKDNDQGAFCLVESVVNNLALKGNKTVLSGGYQKKFKGSLLQAAKNFLRAKNVTVKKPTDKPKPTEKFFIWLE